MANIDPNSTVMAAPVVLRGAVEGQQECSHAKAGAGDDAGGKLPPWALRTPIISIPAAAMAPKPTNPSNGLMPMR
jgi:hypothetical protein